jgi:hypothetical protein
VDKKSYESVQEDHDEFFYELKDYECRYAAFWFKYEREQKVGSKLLLVSWTPDEVNVKVSLSVDNEQQKFPSPE